MLGARTPHAPCASRRTSRAPHARSWCARPRQLTGGSKERRMSSDGTREDEKRRRAPHARSPCSPARREPPATHAFHAHRARFARRNARWRGLVPHGAASEEKARDKDDDRRQAERRRKGEQHHSARRFCSTAAARTTRDARAPRASHARVALAVSPLGATNASASAIMR